MVCQPLLTLCRGFWWLADPQLAGQLGSGIPLRVLRIAQRLLHALLLRGIGLLLRLCILRLW
ncbi:MAG TPA: hypothetical protein PKV60_10650 [Thermomonas sp.]|nr:hypothetical protein [Thermomonas sp.]